MKLWPFGTKREVKQNPVGKLLLSGFGQAAFPQRSLADLARDGYTRNAIVFACVNKIASSLGTVQLQICREDRDGEMEVLPEHPLMELLYRPNPGMGMAQFLSSIAAQYLIFGNVYIAKNDGVSPNQPPVELWTPRPDKMKIIEGNYGLPAAFEYEDRLGKRRIEVDPLTGLGDILHLKSYHPLDNWYGLSPMDAAANSIDGFNSAQMWNYSLTRNGARPSGALVVKNDGTLDDEQYNRLISMIDEQYSGSNNAGKPLLLEGGLDWKEMSLSPKDMDYSNAILQFARWVAAVYSVPPQLINVPGESTYNNLAEAKMALWQDAVLPLLEQVLSGLNRWLAPLYGDDIYIKYDEDAIIALEPRRQQKFDRIKQAEFMTINEKRRALGYEDVEGGDVLLVDAAKVPVDMVGLFNTPADAPPSEAPQKSMGHIARDAEIKARDAE